MILNLLRFLTVDLVLDCVCRGHRDHWLSGEYQYGFQMSFSVESPDLQELSSSKNAAPGKGECPHSLWFSPRHLIKLQTLNGETQLKNV